MINAEGRADPIHPPSLTQAQIERLRVVAHGATPDQIERLTEMIEALPATAREIAMEYLKMGIVPRVGEMVREVEAIREAWPDLIPDSVLRPAPTPSWPHDAEWADHRNNAVQILHGALSADPTMHTEALRLLRQSHKSIRHALTCAPASASPHLRLLERAIYAQIVERIGPERLEPIEHTPRMDEARFTVYPTESYISHTFAGRHLYRIRARCSWLSDGLHRLETNCALMTPDGTMTPDDDVQSSYNTPNTPAIHHVGPRVIRTEARGSYREEDSTRWSKPPLTIYRGRKVSYIVKGETIHLARLTHSLIVEHGPACRRVKEHIPLDHQEGRTIVDILGGQMIVCPPAGPDDFVGPVVVYEGQQALFVRDEDGLTYTLTRGGDGFLTVVRSHSSFNYEDANPSRVDIEDLDFTTFEGIDIQLPS